MTLTSEMKLTLNHRLATISKSAAAIEGENFPQRKLPLIRTPRVWSDNSLCMTHHHKMALLNEVCELVANKHVLSY